MAYTSDKKPLELTALTALANDDTIIVGDTSDVSEVAKSITKANLITTLGIGGGDVVGPASATNNAIPRYDTNTGKLIQDSGVTIDDSSNLAGALISLSTNGLGGTTAQFNTALSDNDFATLAGAETLTNKTLTSPVVNTPTGIVTDDVTESTDKNYVTDTEATVIGNTSGTNTGDEVVVTGAEVDTGTDNTKMVTAKAVKDSKVSYTDGTETLTNKTLTDAKITTTTNAQTGTTYTLVLTDASKYVSMSNAAANTLTVPPNSSVAFAVGTRLMIQQLGAGATTIAAGAGVTINAPSTVPLLIDVQYESRGLLKTATDTWQLV